MSDYCCDAMQTFRTLYDRPFYNPTYIDPKTHDVKSDRLCLQGYRVTPSGKISEKGRGWATVRFCPFCGKPLT